MTVQVRLLEKAEDMTLVEALQRAVWPDSETDVVPVHLLVTLARNGGIVLGAFDEDRLVGFAYGFPGIRNTDTGLQIKHCSHQLGVHPEYQNHGLGFLLKRAQWQMVRHQGVDLITWTYDPLESRNAQLNVHKLGAVSRVYEREVYGDMRDGLNTGLASDRLLVELWVLSVRVDTRLGAAPRRQLDLSQFYSAGARLLNPTTVGQEGYPLPPDLSDAPSQSSADLQPLLLMEIPSDFQQLKQTDHGLAVQWRLHTRSLFEALFEVGYMVTDFVHTPGEHPRSFYVLSYGESTLGG